MHRTALLLGGSLICLAILIGLIANHARVKDEGGSDGRIMIYCAASNQAVMEAVVADYLRDTGRVVQTQYGPSQALLSQLAISRRGELFLPADDSYVAMAKEKHLVSQSFPIANMRIVVVVPKGNPKSIHRFSDLLRPDVRLVQANPETAAIGKLTRETLRISGDWHDLDQATTAYRTTVTDVANDVLLGAADAGVIFDAVLQSYPELEAIDVMPLQLATSRIEVGVVLGTSRHDAAIAFVDYLQAPQHGQQTYLQFGFQSLADDD